jgi:hypothetical protein
MLLSAIALSSQACLYRSIVHVQDGSPESGQLTTLLRSKDTKFFGLWAVQKDVYWECTEVDGKLVCKKACDIKDDKGYMLACPKNLVVGN